MYAEEIKTRLKAPEIHRNAVTYAGNVYAADNGNHQKILWETRQWNGELMSSSVCIDKAYMETSIHSLI